MRILVTGAAGYLGSILCEHLLRAGHEVTALDNFRHGEMPFGHLLVHRHFNIISGDARDGSVVALACRKTDFIIPLAAIVGAPACDADQMAAMTTNRTGVEIAAAFKIPIVFPNTNSSYGHSEAICTEDSPFKPLSLYAKTKTEAERIVLSGDGVVLRLATVFGASPRMRTDLMVNDFVLRAMRDRSIVLYEPNFRRNFIHVRDVAEAFIHAMENYETMRGQVYNCGDTRANMTKLELAQAVQRHIPDFDYFIGKGTDPDKRDYLVSNDKLEATGWKPQYTLDDGIDELKRLYRGMREKRYANA